MSSRLNIPQPEELHYREVIKHDGARWREVSNCNGLQIITTGSFRDIMAGKGKNKGLILVNSEGNQVGEIGKMGITLHTGGKVISYSRHLLAMMNKYKKAYKRGEREKGVRDFIEEGSVAQVYSLGQTGLCIRESLNDNLHEGNLSHKLDRMDAVHHLIEIGDFPRWINVANHYGLVRIPTRTYGIYRQFLIMEQIDYGLTLEDIVIKPRNRRMAEKLKQIFPDKIEEEGQTIQASHALRQEMLEKYAFLCAKLESEYQKHRADFLPDYKNLTALFGDLKPANICVEKLSTPRAGSEIGFWIIDQ